MFSKRNNILLTIVVLFLIAGLSVLQIHNILKFPLTAGFDAHAHADYIIYLKTLHKLPLPYEGWEMWQAPLYYLVASLFPNLTSVRILHFLSWIVLILSSYFAFRYLFKKPILILSASLLTASLPVVLYATPGISNEFFSAALITLALTYYMANHDLKSLKNKVILGVLLGLSLLAKTTAWLAFAVIIFDLTVRSRKNISLIVRKTLPVIMLTITIAGWFYAKNVVLYKNPFISSTDFPNYSYTEKPWDRSLSFFTDLSSIFKLDLFKAHHYSFIGGTYFSWFYDGHNNLVPVQQSSKAGSLLIMFSVPLALAFLIGFIKEAKNINDRNRLLLIYPPLLFLAYFFYNLKIPYYSTVKGVFLVSSVIPFIYFVVRGVEKFVLKHQFIYVLYLVLYELLIIKNFWIIPTWYR